MASMLDVEEATNIEEEARRAALKRAIERLAEDLQNPDQLSKVRKRIFYTVFGALFPLNIPMMSRFQNGNPARFNPTLFLACRSSKSSLSIITRKFR